ncbi:MAG: restriction endonuclease subunit S [Deltaproteobacteria bacterium]|jgi:type I restriction enzyme S subunit|nr:restriction endonuclease subunit S [Deltaproteobacteria bacterium]
MENESLTFGEAAMLIHETVQPKDVGSIPYIGLEHIEEGSLRLNGFGKAKDVTSTKFRFSRGDVLFGKLRPYFRKVIRAPFDGVCSTDIWVVRATPNTNQGYLYYWMASKPFVDFATRGSEGTRMPRAKWEHVSRYEQTRLPMDDQRAIAHILGSLDDKIELNRQMNRTLEAMAQAIFKSWFVDFDPVRAKAEGRDSGLPKDIADLFPDSFEDSELGEMPQGWKIKPIGEAVRCVGGSTPSTKNPSFWNGGTNPFVTPKDMSSLTSSAILDTARHITDAGVDKISSGRLPAGAVLLSSRAPIGYLAITEVPVSVNQGIIAMICDKSLPNYHVLYWTEANMDTIKSNAGGTTFAEISKRNFRPIQVIVPHEHVLEAYVKQVEPLHQQVVLNLQESNTLASFRDTLLPKLLSGELCIPDAWKLLESVI